MKQQNNIEISDDIKNYIKKIIESLIKANTNNSNIQNETKKHQEIIKNYPDIFLLQITQQSIDNLSLFKTIFNQIPKLEELPAGVLHRALFFACKNSLKAIALFIVEQPAQYFIDENDIDVDDQGNLQKTTTNSYKCGDALSEACKRGYLSIVLRLAGWMDITKRFYSAEEMTVIHIAARYKHKALIELFRKDLGLIILSGNGKNILHYACETDDEEFVSFLFQKLSSLPLSVPFDVDECDNAGRTPLHIACEKRNLNVIKYLIRSYANPELPDKQKKTPAQLFFLGEKLPAEDQINIFSHILDIREIFHAARHGELKELMELHHKDPTLINTPDNADLLPLHMAAYRNQYEIVKFLLEQKVDINARDALKSTALHFASMEGHIKVVELLIENRANARLQDSDGSLPIHMAAVFGKTNCIDILLKNFKDTIDAVDSEKITPLYLAVIKNHSDTAEELIKHGAMIAKPCGKDGLTILHVAISALDASMVRKLLEVCLKNGIDPNLKNEAEVTALEFARSNENMSNLMTEAIENYNNTSKLIAACESSKTKETFNVSEVEEILKKKPLTLDMMKNGKTALYIAYNLGNLAIMRLLLANKADPNFQWGNGTFILLLACQKIENLQVIELLIEFKAKLDLANDYGTQPIHVACQSNFSAAVEIFLQKQVNVNGYNKDGLTPLSVAAKHGHSEIIQLFKNHNKLDLTLKNRDGSDVITIAEQHKKLEIVSLLRSFIEVKTESPINSPSSISLLQTSALENLEPTNKKKKKKNKTKKSKTIIKMQNTEENEPPKTTPSISKTIDILKQLNNEPSPINSGDNNSVTIPSNIVEQPLDPNANTIVEKTPQLLLSLYRDNKDSLKAIIETDPNVLLWPLDIHGHTLLHYAAVDESTTFLTWLFEYLQNTKQTILWNYARSRDGDTPLHSAALNKRTENVALLLSQAEVDPHVRNMDGNTPAHSAALRLNNLDVFKLLFSDQQDFDLVNIAGLNVLHLAARAKNLEIVHYLIDTFPQLDYLKPSYRFLDTPLHLVAERNAQTLDQNQHVNVIEDSIKIIQLLLIQMLLTVNTQSIDSTNRAGETALHIAIRSENWEVANFLVQNQADINFKSVTSLPKNSLSPLELAHSKGYILSGTVFVSKANGNPSFFGSDNPHLGQNFKFPADQVFTSEVQRQKN